MYLRKVFLLICLKQASFSWNIVAKCMTYISLCPKFASSIEILLCNMCIYLPFCQISWVFSYLMVSLFLEVYIIHISWMCSLFIKNLFPFALNLFLYVLNLFLHVGVSTKYSWRKEQLDSSSGKSSKDMTGTPTLR